MSTIAPKLPERPEQTARTVALAYSTLEAGQRVAYHNPRNAASIRASAKRYREGVKAECAAANKVYKARAYSKQADIDRRLDLLTEAHVRLGEDRAQLAAQLEAVRAVAERLRGGEAVCSSVEISLM